MGEEHRSINDFLRLDRGFLRDLKEGRINFEEWGLLVALLAEVNPVNGEITANCAIIAGLFGLKPKRAEYILGKLKEKGFIWFDSSQGKRNYRFIIKDYPLSFNREKGGHPRWRSLPEPEKQENYQIDLKNSEVESGFRRSTITGNISQIGEILRERYGDSGSAQ